MDERMIRRLIETAAAQRKYSYAPYSGYRVGAALLARNEHKIVKERGVCE